MGVYAAGNTLPVTGWRDWKSRLALRGLAGTYERSDFPIPQITPSEFWKRSGYVAANFPVPRGVAGEFAQAVRLDHPSKWGLSGTLDDVMGFVRANTGLLLVAGAGLLFLAGGKGRRARRAALFG